MQGRIPRPGCARPVQRRRAAGIPLAARVNVPGGRFTRVSLLLEADGDHGVAVSTELRLDLGDPAWPERLVATVCAQATAGARRLRDELLAQTPGPTTGFVPLAALLPEASPRS